MARSRIDLTSAVQHGLGFAALRFGTALRLAWFPVALMSAAAFLLPAILPREWHVGWREFITLGSVLFFQTIALTVLMRTAAMGVPPHRRSLHLAFGKKELQVLLTYLLTGLVVFVLVLLPSEFTTVLLEGLVTEGEGQMAYFFEEGSLHQGGLNYLYPDGHPGRQLFPLITYATLAGFAYLSLRLYLLPAFVAAGIRKPLRQSLAASGGANTVSVFLLVLVTVGAVVAVFGSLVFLGDLATAITGSVTTLTAALHDAGMGFASPIWAERLAQTTGAVASLLVGFLLQVFVISLFAGFSGAVAAQIRRLELR
jgi:prepilin-type processing-associated H-X9-DG protein